MDLDLSALWSWTVPLWGLFVLVLFLGGVLVAPTILEGMPAVTGAGAVQAGGARKSVRWGPSEIRTF
jgi:hypothetical protein